ncbi:MAG TPA: glycosyltransferase family 9 protein [Mycobacteriales bacterium]|nr:glycosyltransferase family 9 protein [Mycobacteriales bacterium]
MLVLRALGLGDLLTGVPALRALRRAWPEHRLVLAAPAALAPLAALTGAVDAVLDQPGLDRPLRTDRPALAVNLHGRGPESTALLRATDPGELWSFGDGPQWTAAEHEVDRWCRLLRHHGVPADPGDLALARPAGSSPAPGAVVVHPGAASGSRRWPADRFAAVARALQQDGHRVVVTAGPSERGLAAAVGAEPVVTSLPELAALVADAALVVCGDTGVAHLATAYGTPSVLLFGPTPPAEWGPRSGPHTVLWKGEGRGDPHGAHPDPALLALTVPEVLTAARRWVRATAASSQ